MKKMLGIGLIAFLAAGAAFGSVMIRAANFSPSDADFKSLYGGGMMYGGELSFGLSKSLDVWVGVSAFSKKGKTSYTQEETTLSIIPLSGGLKWRLRPNKVVSPYLAVGAEYVLYKETAAIGDMSVKGIGFVGKGGLLIQATGFLGIDAHVAYSSCSMKTSDFTFNVGGFELGAGIVIIF